MDPIPVQIVPEKLNTFQQGALIGTTIIETGEKLYAGMKGILKSGARFDAKTLDKVKDSAQQAWTSVKTVFSSQFEAQALAECKTKVIDLAVRIVPYVCLILMVGCALAATGLLMAAIPTAGATLPVATLLLTSVPILAKVARSTQHYIDTRDKKASLEPEIQKSLELYEHYKADPIEKRQTYEQKKAVFDEMMLADEKIIELKKGIEQQGYFNKDDKELLKKAIAAKYTPLQVLYTGLAKEETKKLYANIFNGYIKHDITDFRKDLENKQQQTNVI